MNSSSLKDLVDRAETLSDYLHEYGNHCDRRSEYSRTFFNYLLSACWEKLYQRFTSWQGLGLVRNFEELFPLFEAHLKLVGKGGGDEPDLLERVIGPGDRTLIHFLYLNEESIFGKMLPYALSSDMDPPPLDREFTKLRQAVKEAYTGDLTCFYTRDTAVDFHYLVYCSFILAGRALSGIKEKQQPLKQTGIEKNVRYSSLVETFKTHILAAVTPMKLLQCVLSSTIFKRHICIWSDNGFGIDRILPKWGGKKNHMMFGKKRGILTSSKIGPSDEGLTQSGYDDDDDINNAPEACNPLASEVRKSVCFC
jgi:hypothetical protein